MAQRIRLFEKKRGNRRTGPGKLGRAGEAMFFGAFLGVGLTATAILFATLVVPQVQVNRDFVEHSCQVIDTRPPEPGDDDGSRRRSAIRVAFEVDGLTYRPWTSEVGNPYADDREAAEAVAEEFQIGRTFRCWYDPADPNNVVLARAYPWWLWLVFAVPISLVVLGLGGLVYTVWHLGRSAERRAATHRRRAGGNGTAREETLAGDFPAIPPGGRIIGHPGQRLAFRLPGVPGGTWLLAGWLLALVVWNGVVALFAVVAVNRHLQGDPDWLLTLFVVPCAAVGVAAVVLFLRQLWRKTVIGPTRVEISDHPLRPGGSYELYLSQTGRLEVEALDVFLVCEEAAIYRQGTDTRLERKRVFERQVYRCAPAKVCPGLPLEAEFQVHLPGAAMHSFRADHNEVQWKVVVHGGVAGHPDFQRSFPLVVHPRANGRSDV